MHFIVYNGEIMEIKVEGKNKKYANYLKECYCGKFSDLSTFLLFKYEYIYFSKTDSLFSMNLNKLSNDSLSHLEIIGKLILLLGEIPELHIHDEINNLFLTEKDKILEINIRFTKEKIILYTENLNRIDDIYIKEVLKKFIIEERKNLRILEILQLKNKTSKL